MCAQVRKELNPPASLILNLKLSLEIQIKNETKLN